MFLLRVCSFFGLIFLVQGFDVLTNNFFENLKGHPLIVEKNLDDGLKQFIDDQISNYVAVVTGQEIESMKKKRSLLDTFKKNDQGVYILSSVTPSATIPVKFPEDLITFQQNSDWFAAALESPDVKQKANYLVIFSYKNGSFIEKARTPVVNGVKIGTIDLKNSTLVAVAENDAPKDNFHNKSGIYQFDGLKLTKIQSIDMHYATDVIFWKLHDEIYMSVAHHKTNSSQAQYDIEIPIYKWLGRHFDEIQRVPAQGARKVKHFVAKNANFLALANFRDDEGNSRIYSYIYKYDYHLEKYELHQRILTRGCTDIEIFTFQRDHQKDTFLAVANSFEEDSDGNKNYQIESIIYKFIDDYFVPFQSIDGNAIEQWLAVERQLYEFQDSGKRFALFATTRFHGLKAFQYDGWSFQEVPQKFPNLLKNPGIQSVGSGFKDLSIVVANKNNDGRIPNVFHLEFKKETGLSEIYEDLSQWCDQGLKKVEELSGSVLDSVLGKRERGDIEDHKDEIEEIESKIDVLNDRLERIKDTGIMKDITAGEIIFNNVTFIGNLNATRINDFETEELLENALDIDEGFELGEVQISAVEIEDSISLNNINGHNINNLLQNSDDLNLNSLRVTGTLSLLEGITIGGKLNGVTMSDDNLLRKIGDQNFSRPLEIESVKIDKMVAESINGQTLSNMEEMKDNRRNLRVKNLIIGGYINDVDVPTLDKYALKKVGDQEISSIFLFDALQGDNLEVFGKISGKNLSNLIGTQSGDYTIRQDMVFKNDLFVDDLQVLDSLNGIKVDDILWRDHPKEQEITGGKIFDDVIIHHAIFLQGHINSDYLDKMNPVVSIDDNIFLEGDKMITGEVQIENLVSAKDVVTSGGVYSLNRLEAEGLKLTAKEIKPHLYFVQQLNVDEIIADTINGKNLTNFVVTGSEETQIIEGMKTFLGDLKITGSTEALKINNVDVEDLENKILKVEGDQTIIGKHHVKHVVAKTMSSTNVSFDTNMTIVPTSDENFTTSDFKIDAIKAKTILVKGLVNDLEFDEIVEDTVMKNTNRTIGGHKYFKNLTVDVLEAQTGVNFDEMPEEINELTIGGPLNITSIKIDNLFFENQCNGVDRDNFAKDNDNGTVDGDHEFDTIIVYGNAYIASSKINEFDINDLAYNSVKIDEAHHFDTVTFEDEVVSKTPIRLDGQIENLDFDNIVLPDQFNSTIFDEKTFSNSLIINGSVNFDSYINGFNMSQFCQFTMGEVENASVIIDGNVFFVKGPNVAKINGADTKKIKEQAWFRDTDTTLHGSIDFEDIIFKNPVRVEGFVDNISLSLINENYFSKSKDQNITATFTFEDELIFENEITVPKMNVDGGMINEINLEEFVRTALLDDYDQLFETVVFFESCRIQNLTGEFTVNGWELDKDVMLYDKVNMVTGPKHFKNLNVEHLKLDKNIKIQNVDVLEWFKNVVLKTTDCNITGSNTFNNASFEKGFQLSGALNGLKFDVDDIMLKNLSQDITATKTIRTGSLNPVSFKGIKLKGLLNGMAVSDLINNQAYRDKNNVFKTSLNLYNNITTNNLVINKMYRGVNMTELINKVKSLGFLNNLVDQYEKLLAMSYKLRESIEGQAYFLHHYKIIQTIDSANNIKRILCPDGVTRLGILVDDVSGTRMDLYGWEQEYQRFAINGSINFPGPLTYVDQVLMGRYLYTESEGTGHFIRMGSLVDVGPFLTNRTINTHSFTLPISQQPCTLFIYSKNPPRIFCESENRLRLKQTLPLNAVKASSIIIEDILYLVTITQPGAGLEAYTAVWKFAENFQHHQSLFEAHPQSVSTVSYRDSHFLAIASGHLQNAMYPGRVEIRKFDATSVQFLPWQSLQLDAPLQVEFALLPTGELVLYVLVDNPTEPLLVFRYEGIAGFKLKIRGSALPQISHFKQFSGEDGEHVIVAQSYDEINVIAAVFKGEKLE